MPLRCIIICCCIPKIYPLTEENENIVLKEIQEEAIVVALKIQFLHTTSKVIILYNPATCTTFFRASLCLMVQGSDRIYVISVAELLGFDCSYISHIY
jgi:hypothetical protein